MDSIGISGDGQSYMILLSGGTDGGDGPTDAAGALVDGLTVIDAKAKGLDAHEYLEAADAYHFFDNAGKGLLKTGPTGTNVMDVQVLLVGATPGCTE
jgi:glycerate-2-kinase